MTDAIIWLVIWLIGGGFIVWLIAVVAVFIAGVLAAADLNLPAIIAAVLGWVCTIGFLILVVINVILQIISIVQAGS